MHGFFNLALRVDATQHAFEIEPIPDSVLKQTLGGKGLGTHFLIKYNRAGVDPFHPHNHLILSVGPLTGSGVWGSCRHAVFTKSPLTGAFAESYSGGTAAEAISSTGYDAIMIHGKSPEPVWLEITESTVYFHPASDFWGLDTLRTEEKIRSWIEANRPEAGRKGILTIGPAGENRVAFAVIENDRWRSAGRTGTGAVMGSKLIKAMAFWGRRSRSAADSERQKQFIAETARTAKDSPGVRAYRTMGTPMLVDVLNRAGGFPTRYWQKGRFEAFEQINAAALHSRCNVQPHACLRCLMACGRLSTVREGRHQGLQVEGPEYETIYAFGGLCEIGSIEEILYLNDLCDRWGIDTITAGNLVAFTIEAVNRRRIDYPIAYGDPDAAARLLEDIVTRRGIGDLLAQGIRRASAEWGLDDLAIHVKGLEPAGYDPRILKGMGLAYGTADRGACHLRSTFYKPELTGLVDPDQIDGKAKIFAEWEDRLTLFDSLILCRFYRDLYLWEPLSAMIRDATGLDLDLSGMRAIASRIRNDARRFNLQEGFTAHDDRLPVRFAREPLPESNRTIAESDMEKLLQEYYQERGWNSEGKP